MGFSEKVSGEVCVISSISISSSWNSYLHKKQQFFLFKKTNAHFMWNKWPHGIKIAFWHKSSSCKQNEHSGVSNFPFESFLKNLSF